MPTYNISAEEFYHRVYEMITIDGDAAPASINKMMHETLVLVCHEGVKNTNNAFGNLFSQVDYLCKMHHIPVGDRVAIQTMRRHSNSQTPLDRKDLMYDARALCLFISAILREDIPDSLVRLIPTENKPHERAEDVNLRYVRCIVRSWDETTITVSTEQEDGDGQMAVKYDNEDNAYLADILHEGMQLNLLDCHKDGDKVTPQLIVVEPDFLVDISAIAACFTDYGHHPLQYIMNRMKPRPNTQAILLGNFAGSALDDIINTDDYQVNNTIKSNFKEKALEFSTCTSFDAGKFVQDANTQANNLKQVVKELFATYDKTKAILEPSFVCERLGIQGRVDLMTTDFRLLVEQKSGRNMNIEYGHPNEFGSFQLEPHYVQLLLYYGVLKYNFSLGNDAVDIRLLYSKYPPAGGLVVVSFYRALFREAIRFRNKLVAEEMYIADNGFDEALDRLTPETLNENAIATSFYQRYLLPQIDEITRPLHGMTPLEHAYFCRMMTFVYREQRLSKVGVQEGVGNCGADLWNMPLSEKKETGNIYTSLTITDKKKSTDFNGYDLITLSVPDQGDDFLPNFRRGDMVYLYSYADADGPDVRRSILFKGVLTDIRTDRLVVHLTDGQQNPDIISDSAARTKGARYFAVEHGGTDVASSGAIRGLHEFITSAEDRKALLLGQREPRMNAAVSLSRTYNSFYDDMLLRARQAQDYFLLVGPPGTGKTSMALRYLVEEELTDGRSNLLLMAYTNRAVDEICSMLDDADIDFMRLGNEYSCDARFKDRLIDRAIDDCPRLDAIRLKIIRTRVIVGTTSMLMSRPFIFRLKHFSLAIVDEASQILEPNIIGLLAAHTSSVGSNGADADTQQSIDKFILIGDYKQLPAVVQQREEESAVDEPLLRDICIDNCRNSLFERLIRIEQMHGRDSFIGILRKQGRMHPDIAEFPNRMFYANEHLEPVPCPHQTDTSLHYTLPSQDALDDMLKMNRMIFIPSEFCRQPDVSDKVNQDEARIVADMLRRIHRFYEADFDVDKTVGVIVPYRNQIAMIRKEIEQLGIPELERVSIDTIERYQGSQRDVIIYSFTVQNYYQLDFLTSNCFVEDGRVIDRKLNVAITRARKQMIITGNSKILSGNAIFKSLMDFIARKTV